MYSFSTSTTHFKLSLENSVKTELRLFSFTISLHLNHFLLLSLTALPVRVAELQVPAGSSGILLGPLGAPDVLDLIIERFERGIDLGIVLTQVS